MDYRLLLNEYKEGILLFEIMEKEVWNRASEDSLGQRKYYNEHQDNYKAGDRLEARIFSTPDKSILDEMRMKIERGDTLKKEDLRKFKSIQNSRSYEKGENKVIDKINWITGIQEAETDGIHYLVEVSRLLPPGGKSFEEARASIISDYQDSLEKSWVAQLRQKYPVKINKKGKKLVAAELRK
jgi:peptidyl-prolyl cis-trans isomerase SurA